MHANISDMGDAIFDFLLGDTKGVQEGKPVVIFTKNTSVDGYLRLLLSEHDLLYLAVANVIGWSGGLALALEVGEARFTSSTNDFLISISGVSKAVQQAKRRVNLLTDSIESHDEPSLADSACRARRGSVIEQMGIHFKERWLIAILSSEFDADILVIHSIAVLPVTALADVDFVGSNQVVVKLCS